MPGETDLREQRQALALAITGRDFETVKAFLHSTLVVKTKEGSSFRYDDFLSLFLEPLFKSNRDLGEGIEIEGLKMEGDTATLTVRRSHWHSANWAMGLLKMVVGNKPEKMSRALETWQRIEGRWQLIESQELEETVVADQSSSLGQPNLPPN